MKAARAGHLCTVQFLISKGASSTHAKSDTLNTLFYRLKMCFGLVCLYGKKSFTKLFSIITFLLPIHKFISMYCPLQKKHCILN